VPSEEKKEKENEEVETSGANLVNLGEEINKFELKCMRFISRNDL
jgi:hypothetical protein